MHKTCVVVLTLFFAAGAFAQSRDSALVHRQIKALTTIWLNHEDYAIAVPAFDSLSSAYKLFPAPPLLNDTGENPQLALIALQKQQVHSDKGVSFNGSYVENFGGGSDDNVMYHRRAQAGLQWDLLSGGLGDNHNKELQLDNSARIAQLKQVRNGSSGLELQTYNTIIYTFNIEKTTLLAERKNISESKIGIITQLYSLQAIPYLDYLDAQQQQADIMAMYNLYAAYNIEMKTVISDSQLPQKPLPAFDIDAEKMFAYAGSANISDSINHLVLENMRLENAAVNHFKLDVFLRYNFYDYGPIVNANRSFVSAGVGFSAPIMSNRANNDKILQAQQKIMSWEQNETGNTRSLTLANLLYEFRYKLKQYEGFSSKRREYVELLRIEHVKQQFGDLEFNPLTALNMLDQLMQIDIELTDLRQQLYLVLLDMNHQLPGIPVANYTKPWSPLLMTVSQHTLDKSIYIWSDDVKANSASFITRYLSENLIQDAIVSPGKSKNSYALASTLIDSLSKASIRTELLIGENSLLKKKDPAHYIDSVVKAMNTAAFTAIHLDVEPHTFSDWDTKKQQYLDDYLEMVQQVKTYCNKSGLQLNVSIPVFYPADFLRRLYILADNVYVMAYEQTDPAKVTEKTSEERFAGPDQTVIALRTKDFSSRSEFDDFMYLLSERMKTKRFAIHDFGSLIALPAGTK